MVGIAFQPLLRNFAEISDKWHFNVLTTTYKTVPDKAGSGQPIKVDTWIPARAGNIPVHGHPVILFIHGGGLYTGTRRFAPFINGWLPEFALSHNAVVVSPDYRLIPESTGQDIKKDIEDFWQWVTSSSPASAVVEGSLAQFLSNASPNTKLDLNRILVTGGSAGGWCSTHLALDHSESSSAKPFIKSLLLQYPYIDTDSAWLRDGNPRFNPLSKNPDREFVAAPPREAFLAFEQACAERRKRGEIVTEPSPTDRVSGSQFYARAYDWILQDQPPEDAGSARDCVAFRRIEKQPDISFPKRTFLIHGTDDSAVLLDDSLKLQKLLHQRFPDSELRLEVFDKLDHGFDGLEEFVRDYRIQDGLKWAAEAWLN